LPFAFHIYIVYHGCMLYLASLVDWLVDRIKT